ncbi:hypothetical protein JHK82_024781 [Glycine max]|nr:hypothetical protein JHK86_024898 [Glycine max]KAG5133593.1 hypothetical protein JHK82_024781 [Glycine max]
MAMVSKEKRLYMVKKSLFAIFVEKWVMKLIRARTSLKKATHQGFYVVWKPAVKEEVDADTTASQGEKKSKKIMDAPSFKAAPTLQGPLSTLVSPRATGAMAHKKKRAESHDDVDAEVPHQAPSSPIHLDCFHHQIPPTIEPNLSVEDIARLQFLVAFLSKNANNIQRRFDTTFQPSIDWMQLPLDVEEDIVTCLFVIHKKAEVAPSSYEMDQPTGIEVLPPPTWKKIRPKVSKPSSPTALRKSIYKIPSGACRAVVSYDKNIIGWCWKIDAF